MTDTGHNVELAIVSILDEISQLEDDLAKAKSDKTEADVRRNQCESGIAEKRANVSNLLQENGLFGGDFGQYNLNIRDGALKPKKSEAFDIDILPIELVSIEKKPNMREIKAALLGGMPVEGFELAQAPEILTIRVKK